MTLKIQSPDGQAVLAALITLAKKSDRKLNLANAWNELPAEIPFDVTSSEITEVLQAYTSDSEICNPQPGKIACIFKDEGNGEYRLTADDETCQALQGAAGSYVTPNSIPGAEIFIYKEVQPESGFLTDSGKKQPETLKTDSSSDDQIARMQNEAADKAAFGASQANQSSGHSISSVSEKNLDSIANQMSDEERKSTMDSYPSYARFDQRTQPGNYVPASEDEKQDQMHDAMQEAAGLCVCACTTDHVDDNFMDEQAAQSMSANEQKPNAADDSQQDSNYGRLTSEDMARIYKPDYMSALSVASCQPESETAKAVDKAADASSTKALDTDESDMVLPYETITTSDQAEQSVQVELANHAKKTEEEAPRIENLNQSAASMQAAHDQAKADSLAYDAQDGSGKPLDAADHEMVLPYETIATSEQAEQSVQVELANHAKKTKEEAPHIANLNQSAASMQAARDEAKASSDINAAKMAALDEERTTNNDQENSTSFKEAAFEDASTEDQAFDASLMRGEDTVYGSREEQELDACNVDFDPAQVRIKDANEPEALREQAYDMHFEADSNPFNQAQFQMYSEGRNSEANLWAYDFEQRSDGDKTEERFIDDEPIKVMGLDENPSAVWSCVRDPQSSVLDVDVEIETESEKWDRLNDLWTDNAKIDRKIKKAQDKITQQKRKISDHLGQIERDGSNAMKSLHESQIRHNKKVIDRKERKIDKLQDQIVQNTQQRI